MLMPTPTHQVSPLTEEQQLLKRFAAGEINAFWQLFQQYRDHLWRCCLKWTKGNSTEAEDLLSQAMLKAWEKVQKFAGKIDNFKSWLTTLTRNFWIDITRRRGSAAVEDIEVYGERHELGLVSVEQTPESALESEEKNKVIRRAIEELPNWLRETFILHYYRGLSNPEIAQEQEISDVNVRQRISRARKILAIELRGYFIGDRATESDTAKVAAKPAKSKKGTKKPAETEAIAAKTVTGSEAVEEAGVVVEEPQETAGFVQAIDTTSGWQKSLSLARSHRAQISECDRLVSHHSEGKALGDRDSPLSRQMSRGAAWKQFYEVQGVSKKFIPVKRSQFRIGKRLMNRGVKNEPAKANLPSHHDSTIPRNCSNRESFNKPSSSFFKSAIFNQQSIPLSTGNPHVKRTTQLKNYAKIGKSQRQNECEIHQSNQYQRNFHRQHKILKSL